jgi:methyltransferase (TIGR00027 family)
MTPAARLHLRRNKEVKMAKQTVGRTALGAATCRLIEQYEAEATRLFNDAVVNALVGAPIRFLMQFRSMRSFTIQQTNNVMPGIFGSQLCRTRYIDDTVQSALSQGVAQVVILGAGFDTRPYRLLGMESVKVFEVDLPAVQDDKKRKLIRHLGQLPANVTFIPMDFDRQSFDTTFDNTSFDFSEPVIFIWEGVTQYISAEAVHQTLSFIAKSALGSSVVFTYVLKRVIERRSDIVGADKMMDFVARDAPFIFGLEPSDLPVFLKPYNLSLTEDVGSTEFQERYLKPIGRLLPVADVERIACAALA